MVAQGNLPIRLDFTRLGLDLTCGRNVASNRDRAAAAIVRADITTFLTATTKASVLRRGCTTQGYAIVSRYHRGASDRVTAEQIQATRGTSGVRIYPEILYN